MFTRSIVFFFYFKYVGGATLTGLLESASGQLPRIHINGVRMDNPMARSRLLKLMMYFKTVRIVALLVDYRIE